MSKPRTNAQNIVKAVVTFAASVSTYAVTTAVIRNNVSDPETKAQKAALAVGSYVIGQTVAEKTRRWTDAKVEQIFTAVDEIKGQVEQAKEDQK